MGYRWRLDGVNDYAQFANSISIDLGLNAYTVELKCILNAFPATFGGLLGRNGTAAGFFIMPNGAIATYSSGTQRYASAAGFFILGELHTYRLEHDANGAWRVYRDGVQFGSGVFNTGATAAPITRIGQATNGDNSYCSMDLEYLEVTGVTNAQKWDANLSNGTGTTLPTSSGSNAATLVNVPADNSQWIFYNSVSASQNITVAPAKQQDVAAVVSASTTQVLSVAGSKQQDIAAAVAIGATQAQAVAATKQQDSASSITAVTTQVLPLAEAQQQDKAAIITVSTPQVLVVPSAMQMDLAAAIVVSATQVVSVAGTMQRDGAATVGVSLISPGVQPVSVVATKQEDAVGLFDVGLLQNVSVTAAAQDIEAHVFQIAQSFGIQIAKCIQQDNAQTVLVSVTQAANVETVNQLSEAQLLTVTQSLALAQSQPVEVQAVKQIDRTQLIAVHQGAINYTVNPMQLKVARKQSSFTARLTTPRFTSAKTHSSV